jgi:hypothetical protein
VTKAAALAALGQAKSELEMKREQILHKFTADEDQGSRVPYT